MNQSALNELSALLPAERVMTQDAHLAAYESDGLTAFKARPRAVVVPETAEEVIEVVRWCHEREVPFVARGSGTSLSGGSLPVEDGIVIALNRLNRILEVDPIDRVAVVEPGVINLDVSRAAEQYGLHFAPDPSSQVDLHDWRECGVQFGGRTLFEIRDDFQSCDWAEGRTGHRGSGRVWGGAAGSRLGPTSRVCFCGSEGLFGVGLEFTLRLLPRAQNFHTVLAGYGSLEEAGSAVSAVIESGLLPGALEIMDALAIEAAEAAVACGYPKGAEAVLIVELEGPVEKVAARAGATGQNFEGHQLF